jgi:hypothetical protein
MKTQHAAGLAGLALAALAPAAHAVSITKDDVTPDITGIVNGYYAIAHRKCPAHPKSPTAASATGCCRAG